MVGNGLSARQSFVRDSRICIQDFLAELKRELDRSSECGEHNQVRERGVSSWSSRGEFGYEGTILRSQKKPFWH
ncbi:Uncharacterised protein [Mycobacterium tuberculosis]|nr:Uncharacterised protein [Mycobacterium tuberculosis]